VSKRNDPAHLRRASDFEDLQGDVREFDGEMLQLGERLQRPALTRRGDAASRWAAAQANRVCGANVGVASLTNNSQRRKHAWQSTGSLKAITA
jgi:hypothetical protein